MKKEKTLMNSVIDIENHSSFKVLTQYGLDGNKFLSCTTIRQAKSMLDILLIPTINEKSQVNQLMLALDINRRIIFDDLQPILEKDDTTISYPDFEQISEWSVLTKDERKEYDKFRLSEQALKLWQKFTIDYITKYGNPFNDKKRNIYNSNELLMYFIKNKLNDSMINFDIDFNNVKKHKEKTYQMFGKHMTETEYTNFFLHPDKNIPELETVRLDAQDFTVDMYNKEQTILNDFIKNKSVIADINTFFSLQQSETVTNIYGEKEVEKMIDLELARTIYDAKKPKINLIKPHTSILESNICTDKELEDLVNVEINTIKAEKIEIEKDNVEKTLKSINQSYKYNNIISIDLTDYLQLQKVITCTNIDVIDLISTGYKSVIYDSITETILVKMTDNNIETIFDSILN